MRPKGSPAELEARRRLAMDRLQEGYSQDEVARFLGVHVRSVQRWVASFRCQGSKGLAAKPAPGRPAKLSARQERIVLGWLAKSPTAFGFANELWTARRVGQLIEQKFGVHFHPRYLNAWLSCRGITPQKPQRVFRERNQAAIDTWLRVRWPEILKKGLARTLTSC